MIETAYRDQEVVVPPLAGYRGFTLAEPLETTLRRVADQADPATENSESAIDLGSVWLQVPEGAELQNVDETGDPCSIQLIVPSGRISISVLVAPETGSLWLEMADEIAVARKDDGALVSSEQGAWGQEIIARSNGDQSLFIGMDGQGWMLYGVASGPENRATELGNTLRDLINDSVVSAATSSELRKLPVRTALPLGQPDAIEELAAPETPDDAADLFRDPMEPRKPIEDAHDWMPTQWSPPKREVTPRVADAAADAPTQPSVNGPSLDEPGWLTQPEWIAKPKWLTVEQEAHAPAFGPHRPVPAGMSAVIAGVILVLGTASMLVIASSARQQPVAIADVAGEPATALTIAGLDPAAPKLHIAEHPPIIDQAPVAQTPSHHQAKATPAATGQAASKNPTHTAPAAGQKSTPAASSATTEHKPVVESPRAHREDSASEHRGHATRSSSDDSDDSDFDEDFDNPDAVDKLTDTLTDTLLGIG
ncbi:DUF3710 domain-containing protein [Pseudonocardia spinosispora]|uniref:DUF3710 domain-containing protein n=1 Tax=Pseudonocardia spinosispora TaxID=103441 RepID=UPI00041933EC|nr:DUF3710 domain-containing protein [Pseudonocardia spinosispora]